MTGLTLTAFVGSHSVDWTPWKLGSDGEAGLATCSRADFNILLLSVLCGHRVQDRSSLWLVQNQGGHVADSFPLLWRNHGKIFSRICLYNELFSLLIQLRFHSHSYLLAHKRSLFRSSFGILIYVKSKPWLNPSCASTLYVLFQLSKLEKCVTMRLKP